MAQKLEFKFNKRKALDYFRGREMSIGRTAAEFMRRKAIEYCPVDTGFLRDSIVIVERISNEAEKKEWVVIATAPYAAYVEMGHFSVRVGGRFAPVRHTHPLPVQWVPPNPFMRKALADTIREFPRLGFSASNYANQVDVPLRPTTAATASVTFSF